MGLYHRKLPVGKTNTHYPVDTERRSLDNSRVNPTREPPVEKINHQTTGLPLAGQNRHRDKII